MARIIEPSPYKTTTFRTKCPKCCAVVEFEFADLVEDDVGHHGDYCVCPSCQGHIRVLYADWPGGWRDIAAKRDRGYY